MARFLRRQPASPKNGQDATRRILRAPPPPATIPVLSLATLVNLTTTTATPRVTVTF